MPVDNKKERQIASKPRSWWDQTTHADRRPALLARARIKTAIRNWFQARGFIEVDTTCLQVSPGAETHLHAFQTELIGNDQSTSRFYLHTSPEFACKKLLAAGETKIFTFAPVFRNRERGPIHHPEFTMLEWYRANEPYDTVMSDCGDLLRIASDETQNQSWQWRERTCDPRKSPTKVTVTQAFNTHANIDIEPTFDPIQMDREAFAKLAQQISIKTNDDDTWSDIFSRILASKVEPNLGAGAPTFLTDYPIHEAALARPTPSNPSLAERFELYCCGIELANGFGELTDANEQRARIEAEMNRKHKIYGERYPIDDDFINAVDQMPAASGAALGFDRLVMLATGATRIDQIIWTPLPDPTNPTNAS